MASADPQPTALDSHRNPITLTRFLLQERSQFKEATGNFAMLLQSIQLACKVISNACNKAGISNLYGVAGGAENASGDTQKKLDVFSNDVFINALAFSNQTSIMCSEENDDPIVPAEHNTGGYAVVFDPLDGSSNIDANVSVGTIFGIYKKEIFGPGEKPSMKSLLRPGTQLLAAGYALYGSATMLVLTTGLGVNGFVLDPVIGEFILTHRHIKIPKKGSIYSVNEGNYRNFDVPTKAFVELCKNPPKGKPKKARYIGSMVGDVHRTLLYGGIFCYPADKESPRGKLRLLYEGNPMAFIVEQAGGKASTGWGRVMEVVPAKLHERCPIFMGSSDDVDVVEKLYRECGSAEKEKRPQSAL